MYGAFATRRVSVAEAEAANSKVDERLGPEPVAFGFLNAEWKRMVEQMQPGDELWEFDTPQEWWQGMMGRSGYLVKRDGVEVGVIIVRMN